MGRRNKKVSIENYLDQNGKVESWPSKLNSRRMILDYVSAKIQEGVKYSEKEITEVLAETSTCVDGCFLRRELVDFRYLEREKDGSTYWKAAPRFSTNTSEEPLEA